MRVPTKDLWSRPDIVDNVVIGIYGVAASSDHYQDKHQSNVSPIPAILALKLQPGETVLDIGCAVGNSFPHLRELHSTGAQSIIYGVRSTGRIIGIDLYGGLIDKARKSGLADELYVTSAENLSMIADESVDAILLSMTLHWVPNQRQALEETLRVLKSNGRLAIRGFTHESHQAFDTIYAKVMSRKPYSGFPLQSYGYGQFNPGILENALLTIGYRNVETKVSQKSRIFEAGQKDPPDTLMDNITLFSGNLVVAHLPNDLQEQAILDLRAEIRNEAPINLQVVTFVIKATK